MIESTPVRLSKGANVRLRDLGAVLTNLTVLLSVQDHQDGPVELDVSLLLLGEGERVRDSSDFVFYNQPVGADGAIHLREKLRRPDEGTSVDSISLDLDRIPPEIHKVVLVGSLDGATGLTFGELTGARADIQDSADARDLITFDIAAEGSETALIFGEFYLRDDEWRFRAVSQGYADGLERLVVEFGVDVAPASADEDGASPAIGTGTNPDQPGSVESNAGDRRETEPRPGEADPATSEVVDEPGAGRVSVARRSRPPQLPQSWNKTIPERDASDFDPARLFPVAGIGSKDEQERRATSILLSVVEIVREFGVALFKPLGAPSGTFETFVEVPFGHDGQTYRPDGLIRGRRGSKTWTALVEVKTSSAQLTEEQVSTYVDIAKEHSFDAVITISNTIASPDGDHPVAVDRRKLRKVALRHLSWAEVRTVADLTLRHQNLAPTKLHILREFLRYVEHDRSGLHGFQDMGPRWTKVRDAIRAQTLRASDAGAREIVERYDELMRHTALNLTRALGEPVKANTPAAARDQVSRINQLAESGMMFGSLRVPGALDTITVCVDIRADRVHASLAVPAPRTGRPTTRVNWLVRQLEAARETTRLEAFAAGSRYDGTAELLAAVRENPGALTLPDGKDIKQFSVSMTASLGTKRAGASGSLVSSVDALVHEFYGTVVQNLRPWRP